MVRLALIESEYEKEIFPTKELINHLKENKIKTIALFASIQFATLDKFTEELEKEGLEIKITKAKRTNKPLQVLGCDCYSDSFAESIINDSDIILYVGDGMFHPKALLLAQIKTKIKPVLIFNPISQSLEIITEKDIEKQVQKMKRNLRMFLNSESIGILVTIKPGQQYFLSAKRLKEKLESEGKKAYIFLDDSINLNNLENYPFIQSWVNTACPRIGTDDIVNFTQPIINLKEASNPITALEDLENGKS